MRGASRGSTRGVILVGIMGILALLSLVVTDLLFNIAKEMRYQSLFSDREELRQSAYNYLALTLGALSELNVMDKGLKSPAFQAWDTPGIEELLKKFEPPEDITVQIESWDETGKLPLHKADETMLNELFAALDLSKEAGMLTDSLLDFLEKDAEGARQLGARESFYQRQDPPYYPKEDDLYSFEELSMVQGFEEAFFAPNEQAAQRLDTLKKVVSLHHKGPVNVNTSNHFVRYVLSRMDEGFKAEALERELTGDSQPEAFKRDAIEEPEHKRFFTDKGELLGEYMDTRTRILGLRIQAQRYERHFALEAYVAVPVEDAEDPGKSPEPGQQAPIRDSTRKPPTLPEKEEDETQKEKKKRQQDASQRVKHLTLIALREL